MTEPLRPARDDSPADLLLGRYLGPEPTSDEEPSAADLTACLADEPLERGARRRAEAYLAAHPALADALRAALAAATLAVAPPSAASRVVVLPLPRTALRAGVRSLALTIDVPPLALAAAGELPPIPEDRQLLSEVPGRFRLVYFRRGQRARVALFVAAEARPRPRLLACTLDGVAQPLAVETEGQQVDLGPVGALTGCTLALELLDDGEPLSLELTFGAAGEEP